MSTADRNIITAVNRLGVLLQSNTLNEDQKKFIMLLLNGVQDHSENNTFFALIKQKSKPEIDELNFIKGLINSAINQSSLPTTYKKCLLEVKKDIDHVIEILTHIRRPTDDIIKHRIKKLKKYTYIYDATENFYHGKLIVPLMQGIDPRLGTSDGVCFGYISEWLRCLLSESNPFGIDVLAPPFFKPIKPNHYNLKNYLELNHGIPLNDNIFNLQNLQGSNAFFEKMNEGIPDSFEIISEPVQHKQFYSNLESVAENIINSMDSFPNSYFEFSMHSFNSGHAMGFGRDNHDCYHFFDVNSGWFHFNSKEDMRQWLPFYLGTIDYSKKYDSYEITAYTKIERNNFNHAIKVALSFPKIILHVLYFALFSFFIYKAIAIKRSVINVFNKNENAENDTYPKISNTDKSTDDTHLSKDDSYKTPVNSTYNSNFSTINGLLDHPQASLASARKRAENNFGTYDFKLHVNDNTEKNTSNCNSNPCKLR